MSDRQQDPDAAYEPPVLTELGSLEELTSGESGPNFDGGLTVSPAT